MHTAMCMFFVSVYNAETILTQVYTYVQPTCTPINLHPVLGAPTDCLQVLTQRSQLPGRTTPSSLQSAQAAVLCLLCTAHTHGNQ